MDRRMSLTQEQRVRMLASPEWQISCRERDLLGAELASAPPPLRSTLRLRYRDVLDSQDKIIARWSQS